MASQVAYNSQAYSTMSSSSSSSTSSSVVAAGIGSGSPEDNERLLRHVTEDAGLRKEALDALIRAARRGNGRLALREPLSLFRPVSLALRDPDWEVRNKAVNLLVEVMPKFGPQLSEGMADALPGLVGCLADIKVANRRATTQCLHTYMKTMGSANTEPVLGAIIRYGLDASDPELRRNVCVSVPVLLTPDLAGGNFSQLVEALSRCLHSKDEAMANAALHALEAIRSTLGDQLFNGYVQQLNPPLRRYYYQVSGHTDPSLATMATAVDAAALSRSPSIQRRPIPGIADSVPASQYYQQQQQQQQQQQPPLRPAPANASSDAFGCVPRHLVDQLDDREDYSLRAQAIEELRTHLRLLDTLEAAVPHMEKLLTFLYSLLDDVNFRIAIVTLDILYLIASRFGNRFQPHVRSLLAGITKRMSDGKNVVRTALMKLVMLLMNNHRPQLVLDHLLSNLEHRNSRVRQETLNMTIAALVTFPSSDFDLSRLCSCIAPSLLDPKRQVRHAALEVMALLAQSLGNGRLQPLQLAVRDQESRPEAEGLFEAVMTRLAKRLLPRLNPEGLAEYAIPVPSSATRRPGGAGGVSGGANEDWVMQAAAGSYGSARSRSELVDLETDSVAASDRRKSSAGRLAKGKLPWEAASDVAQAPSQDAGRQQPSRSNDQVSSSTVPKTRQLQQQQQPPQPQQQPQQQQKPSRQPPPQPPPPPPPPQPPQQAEPIHQGPSAYVTNGRVKKFSDIPAEQPRKVKRFLDQSERLELHQGDSTSQGTQWNSSSKGSYSKALEQQQQPRQPKSKRPELITTEVLDELPSTSRSSGAAAELHHPLQPPAAIGKLPAIAKQQTLSRKAVAGEAVSRGRRSSLPNSQKLFPAEFQRTRLLSLQSKHAALQF